MIQVNIFYILNFVYYKKNVCLNKFIKKMFLGMKDFRDEKDNDPTPKKRYYYGKKV